MIFKYEKYEGNPLNYEQSIETHDMQLTYGDVIIWSVTR